MQESYGMTEFWLDYDKFRLIVFLKLLLISTSYGGREIEGNIKTEL